MALGCGDSHRHNRLLGVTGVSDEEALSAAPPRPCRTNNSRHHNCPHHGFPSIRTHDMMFSSISSAAYRGLLFAALIEAGRHSLPITRTTIGFYWDFPVVPQHSQVGFHMFDWCECCSDRVSEPSRSSHTRFVAARVLWTSTGVGGQPLRTLVTGKSSRTIPSWSKR